MYAYLDTFSGSSSATSEQKIKATGMKNKLATLTGVTLDVSGDAKIIPNDLGYISFLTHYVGNVNSSSLKVNVSGNVTFGSGSVGTEYENDSIEEVADNLSGSLLLSASGTITLPDGSDIDTFFGKAKVEKDNIVIVDEVEYIADENSNFASSSTIKLDGLTSLYTGNLTDFKINLTNS
ncbi:MAG: hypothetical protein LBD88_01355 [Candidatus Peribacteria bacterium]|nr:hypothetical protein [Candidatus Peribacteria bacterium]